MSNCSRCGAAFSCGMVDGDVDAEQPCWCTRIAPLHVDWLLQPESERAVARCLCRNCLQAATADCLDKASVDASLGKRSG